MIPLGHAVEHVTQVSHLSTVARELAGFMPAPVLAGVFLVLASLVSQAIDNSVAVIFLGPMALEVGRYTDTHPTWLLSAVALGSSLTFMLPTSCRSNLLVTGAGGYKARDFMRVGSVFSLVVGAAILAALVLFL